MQNKVESRVQHTLIERLKETFPGCVVLKNDAGYKKNIPDLTVFYKDHYAMLEVKASKKAYLASLHDDSRKNQEYWINKFGEWTFAAFVYPENMNDILEEMKEVFV